MSLKTNPVTTTIDAQGVATVTLDRPDVGNAYNEAVIEGLLGAMREASARPDLRVVVLRGNGRHFQAGADLKWIREVAGASAAENERVSRATAEAVDQLNRLPVPTVALVQGGCFGGGTGMIAACDVVIAADNAQFSISEVRWGLTAAIIIPQLSDAISARQLRRYALTAERFDAAEALRIGLVHMVVPADGLAAAGEAMVARLLENGPRAMAETKAAILDFAGGGFDRPTFDALVTSHAAKRRSAEAAEGLASFAEKRAAQWRRAD
jgi:methylglutaconyl-CoA hydratase